MITPSTLAVIKPTQAEVVALFAVGHVSQASAKRHASHCALALSARPGVQASMLVNVQRRVTSQIAQLSAHRHTAQWVTAPSALPSATNQLAQYSAWHHCVIRFALTQSASGNARTLRYAPSRNVP